MKLKKRELILAAFVFSIMLVGLVSAAGVSAPYWEGNPLTMIKGEIKTVYLNLQNMVGDEDITYQAKVTEGSDIASLEEDTYFIKAGTSDTLAELKIKIPADSQVGQTTKVKVEFKTVTSGEGGMVTMGTGATIIFDVIVSEETAKQNNASLIWIITLIVAAAIMAWVIYKTQPKKQHTKKK